MNQFVPLRDKSTPFSKEHFKAELKTDFWGDIKLNPFLKGSKIFFLKRSKVVATSILWVLYTILSLSVSPALPT